MNLGTLFYLLPVIGILTGLAGARYRRVPLLATALVTAVYVLYVGSAGIWAATCWNCDAGISDSRADVLLISAVFFGVVVVTTLAGILLGARFATMVGRLRRTFRELRGATTGGQDADV